MDWQLIRVYSRPGQSKIKKKSLVAENSCAGGAALASSRLCLTLQPILYAAG
jgi:hypothetical protein